jgi:hypothetical protein
MRMALSKTVLFNGLLNLGLTIVFVALNNLALQSNLEETFVSLALLFGMTVIATNALYIAVFCRK